VFGDGAGEMSSRAASIQRTGETSTSSLPNWRQAEAVLASLPHGRELRELLDAMGVTLNGGMKARENEDPLVMLRDKEEDRVTVKLGDLRLYVIAPLEKRIDKLRKKWEEEVRKHPDPVVLAAFADQSVPNLSSIVVVADLKGKRMLLTGDARGNDILDGLEQAGLLDSNGAAHFDVLKMPHHGSDRNVTLKWLQKITADAYVVSANGQYGALIPGMAKGYCAPFGRAHGFAAAPLEDVA
jgi:hypothetical protein